MPWIPNTVISSGSSSGLYSSAQLVRYVDYIRGSDSNTGLSPSVAMKTIQAAYNNLKTVAQANYTPDGGYLGVGEIHCLPGYHDVGTGVVIDYQYPVDIFGQHSGIGQTLAQNSASVLMSSSGAATALIEAGDTTHLMRGSRFKDLSFVVDLSLNTSLTSIIRVHQLDYLEVEGCLFSPDDGVGSTDIIAIDMQSIVGNQDNAWYRIINNRSKRFTVLRCGTGANFNRGVIEGNQCFFDGGTTGLQPGIWLQGDVRGSTIINNNFDGGQIAIQCDSNAVDKNTFIANSGEDAADGTKTFYNFTGSQQHNFIFGGHCTAFNGGTPINGTWITFAAAAHSNMVFGICDPVGATGAKQKTSDSSTLGNRYWNPNGDALLYKTGTAPTISDSDFPFGASGACQNGLQAVTYGSTGPVVKMWTRANGSWFSVVMA